MSDKTGTVKLHRVFATTPEKLFKAFVDRDALAKWLPPYGFVCNVDTLDAREGGTFRMSFANFSTGKKEFFGGRYIEFVPGKKLRYTDQFENAALPGTMETTVEIRPVVVGAELNIVQTGIPAAIPPEACYLGWQESLKQLAHVVEPNIPDGA